MDDKQIKIELRRMKRRSNRAAKRSANKRKIAFKQLPTGRVYVEPVTLKVRKTLMAKSLLCFGKASRYKIMQLRGRKVLNKDGKLNYTIPISAQEIENTMDYILQERKKNQEKIFKKMEEENG